MDSARNPLHVVPVSSLDASHASMARHHPCLISHDAGATPLRGAEALRCSRDDLSDDLREARPTCSRIHGDGTAVGGALSATSGVVGHACPVCVKARLRPVTSHPARYDQVPSIRLPRHHASLAACGDATLHNALRDGTLPENNKIAISGQTQNNPCIRIHANGRVHAEQNAVHRRMRPHLHDMGTEEILAPLRDRISLSARIAVRPARDREWKRFQTRSAVTGPPPSRYPPRR